MTTTFYTRYIAHFASYLDFRRAVASSDIAHGDVTIANLGAKPNDDGVRGFINVPHHAHLCTLFNQVLLVDADSVDPESARLMLAAKCAKGGCEVLSDGKGGSGQRHGHFVTGVTPCVR